MSLLEPECHKRRCIHFQGVRWLGEEEDSEVSYCTAFPSGIPEDIVTGKNLHLKPVKGDNGILYEKDPNA